MSARSQHGHSPRGDGICQRNGDAGAPVLVSDDFRIDVERFREVGAHVRAGRTGVVLFLLREGPTEGGISGCNQRIRLRDSDGLSHGTRQGSRFELRQLLEVPAIQWYVAAWHASAYTAADCCSDSESDSGFEF